ncbi:hypothetical protein [Sideroxydans lithotrophicus]|uniref:Uncharacterized protein n=1 Tax=Sideroxydans lithotrophicus (strain ES-1) TaxID=580332 RepID=D5CPT5_SIDLE|nr:hypothetical protein [Sideroxydans lithotrophicus]ADE13080.1 hypothetical protein Slit_2855 [Sideroxydans lithotrophicus ES-1]
MIKTYTNTMTVSAETNVNEGNVKAQSAGRNQNGQPVGFGQPLFIIG